MLLTDARRRPHRRRTARWCRSPSRTGRVGPRRDRRGHRARHRRAGARPARPVPAAGGDRRRPRRGARRGGHRLAADPRALRAAGADRARADVTLNRAVAVAWSTGRAPGSALLDALDGDDRHGRPPPAGRRAGAPARDGRRRRRGAREPTGAPRGGRRACPSSATSRTARRGCDEGERHRAQPWVEGPVSAAPRRWSGVTATDARELLLRLTAVALRRPRRRPR